jgi:hypothetical protein
MLPYKVDITFNKKKYSVKIILDRIVNSEVQCDYEIFTEDRMSGDEFQKLKAYLINEGYVDEAYERYEKFTGPNTIPGVD